MSATLGLSGHRMYRAMETVRHDLPGLQLQLHDSDLAYLSV